jgi:protein SCO1/2
MKTSTSSSSSETKAPLLTLAATSLVAIFGCAALYQATMGFQVVSTEDGRRLEIEREPRSVPFAALDWPSRPLLGDVLSNDGRVTIVSFIYTSCTAICSVLGNEFQQMQETIRARGLQDKVRLMSISFDPRDDAQQLGAYAIRQHADRTIWNFAGIPDGNQRKAVLDTFGVVVVPAPFSEYVHNAAFHVVGPSGRLEKIDDYDSPDRALADAVAMYDAGRK